MNSMFKRFNARVPWPFRLLLLIGIGFCLKEVVIASIYSGWAVTRKLTDRATVCPWSRVASYYFDLVYRDKQLNVYEAHHVLTRSIGRPYTARPVRDVQIAHYGGCP